MRLKSVELFLVSGLGLGIVSCAVPTTTSSDQASTPSSPVLTQASEGGEGGEGGEGEASAALQWGNKLKDGQVVSEFTSQVVLPKYQQYRQDTAALAQTLSSFGSAPSEATLKAAREAWSVARISWEQTESFTFGPAGSLGYDGAMDSWPVNETDIEKILAGSEPLTPERVAQLQDTERGMHTIEFVLFGAKNDKTLTQFTERDREFLASLGQDLSTVATALWTSWQTGANGQPPYRDVFGKAGEAGNSAYPTVEAGVQEMVTGILHSLEEVGAEKLGVPFKEQDTKGLESRFSFQTIHDLKSNLQSAENAYLGTFPQAKTAAKATLSTHIAQINSSLDTQVKQQFQAAKASLDAIPAPLEISLTDPKAAASIQAAQTAVMELHHLFEQQVVPLI